MAAPIECGNPHISAVEQEVRIAFREPPVHEVREVLRLRGESYRPVAGDVGESQLADGLVAANCGTVHPVRRAVRGAPWEALAPHEELTRGEEAKDLRLTKLFRPAVAPRRCWRRALSDAVWLRRGAL